MTRATIKASDPMPTIRKTAMAKVDVVFNQLALEHLHRDHAHASKRAVAGLVAAGGASTPEFATEAMDRGLRPVEMAALVLSMPDNHARRELARQTVMLKIERASTTAEIDGILSNVELGIQ